MSAETTTVPGPASTQVHRRRAGHTLIALALLLGGGLAAACSSDDSVTATSTSASSTVPTGTSSRPTTSSASGSTTVPGTGTSTAPTTAATAVPPATTASTAVIPRITTAPPGPTFEPATAVVEQHFPGTNRLAVLTDVRLGRNDGFDRVVFQFRNNDSLPGYLVDYRPLPLTADPSDLPLVITGDHGLVVRMQAASRFRMDTDYSLVYPGPSTVTASADGVTEVVLRGDFEAMLSWVIGVRGARPFRVFTLNGPPRLVVDIAT